jgi:very-short-patch-repair endonuclease
VISRAQALECGVTHSALRYRLRAGGPWQRLLPGVYLTVTGAPTVPQTEIAALLYAGPGSVITGLAALRRHGMRLPRAAPGVPPVSAAISVLIPVGQVRRSRSFVRVRPTAHMPERVCYEGVVQFTLPARAVADAARELGSFREVRGMVADTIQQRWCTLDLLAAEVASGPVRGSAWLRRSLTEAIGGIRSGAEGDLGDLLRRSGLPIPMFNARLYIGQTFVAVADSWWAEAGVAVEVDSREWHLSPEDWERTLERHARMSAHGIIVLHFTPRQIRDEPGRVIAGIKSALAAGRSRPALAVRALPSEG